ncbi:hypothetical protein BY996DRAFT_87206 [Phakopsora pachyrhizi]|uniref:Uncharacterized protein n=1 Tax=Phakopsora pachyrhizi TaxID=170000 RepID=A0AAV0BAP6_PHAPC|nr:hypothetical protein BY996DRAFT_87206 [Phakopsora pachyrhizi]CAH7683659.1 hypothetical protein PPACK8108_LOCUS17297 [Phakopsora pachyrhizi]
MLYTIEISSINYSGKKMISRVKLILILFYLWSCCEIIKGMFPYNAHSLFDNDILDLSRERISSSENNWREVGRGIEASEPKTSITPSNDLLKGAGWDEGQSLASFLEPSLNFIPINDNYCRMEDSIRSSTQLIPNFSENDLFKGTGWDGKQSFASLLEPDNVYDTVHSQNHGMLSSHHVDNAVPLEHPGKQASFNQQSTGKFFAVERPNIPESFYESKFQGALNSFKNQNIPLNQNTLDTSSVLTYGDARFISGVHPYDAHLSLSNNILSASRGKVSSNENHWKDIGRGNQASDAKALSTVENNLLRGTGWREGQSFTSLLEPSINSNPVVNQYYNTEKSIRYSNQLIPNFSENDLFEGIGWDGEQSFASLLEPENTYDTVHSQNHIILSSHHVDNSAPLEHAKSISAQYANFDSQSTKDSLIFYTPTIFESSENSNFLRTVEKKSLKKRKTKLNLKSLDAFTLVSNEDVQNNLFQPIEKTIQMKIPKHEKFSTPWWHDVCVPGVINSLTDGENAALGFQIFLDRMDILADELLSSYEDVYFWEKVKVDNKNLFTESIAEKTSSDRFKREFGDIINQGNEPYHISLFRRFREEVSLAGFPENLSQFLPLFDAMETEGKKTGFFYIDKVTFLSFFRIENRRGEATDSVEKLKIPSLDDNFYQLLSNQLNEICVEDFFNNDYRILKYRVLLTYIKYKSVPAELKVYRGILRGKLLMRNLYLTITTLINKIFCEGRDDLNKNFSKRQKEAIEFYDLVWKSFRLAKPDGFIIDTSALPSLVSKHYYPEMEFLINNIVKYIKANVPFKCDQTTLRYVWKFVDLWLIYYRVDLYTNAKKLYGHYRGIRNFALSLLNFLFKLYKRE